MSAIRRYILPLSLQVEWFKAAKIYPTEWVAGLKLKDEVIEWFNFKLGDEHEVEFIDLKGVLNAVGTVHYHPYEHSLRPIPSIEDGLAWIYLSYWEIPDNRNPIFFIVFSDGYSSWAMFPKPPLLRRVWKEEFEKAGMKREREEEVSLNTFMRLLKEDLIKTGIFQLGRRDIEFSTF